MNKPLSVLHYQKAPDLALTGVAASLPKLPDEIANAYLLMAEVEAKYPEIKGMDPKAKVAFVEKRRADIILEVASSDRRLKDLKTEMAALKQREEQLGDLANWSAESGLKIERPDGPSFRRLRKAVAEGRTAYLGKDPMATAPAMDFEKEVFRLAEILVIEHNWAAAFNGANVENASIRLPYDVCAFEFKFSGRPVIAFAIQADADILFCPAISCGDIWIMTDFVFPLDFDPTDERTSCMIELLAEVSEQIKAACIALDAEVAEATSVREAHSGSGSGSSHPLKAHHVVSLANRRARPAALSSGDGTGRRKRLHFRRGHWRHFEAHKTWIKWMLVGDPDLGFVEKEYRL